MLWTKSFRYWMAIAACSLVLAGPAPLLAQEESTPPAAAAEGAPPEPADEAEATPAEAAAPAAETPAAETPAAETPAAETPAPETPAPPATETPADETAAETNAPAATETPAAAPEATTESAEAAPEGAAAPAAAAAPEKKPGMSTLVIFLIVVAVVVLPFWLGGLIAQNLRLPDYGWKIGLALGTIVSGTVICYFGWPPRLGPDLSGGINLIYEVAPDVKDQNIDMDKLIGALSRRINPGGIKEVMIRPYGERQIEIIIPKADDAEIELVKRSLGTAGALEFRIVANREDHAQVIEAALASENRQVVVGGTTVARWVKLDPQQFDAASAQTFITRPNPRGDLDVLVMMDDFNVTGEYLDSASPGIDQGGRPSVNFTFDARGENRFAELTTENAPVQGASFKRQLGIVLDNTLLSAPSLNEPITGGRGQISGGNFTKAEVDFLVSILNAGSLPAALTKEPISEQVTSPTLGGDTVRTGAWASGVSIVAVMVFMAIYYRFSGLVACLALLVNLILLLAVMILIKAAFTLPGIAGLVLTVGMAVDANVLIYERIREEIARGAALRMAIRNGFDRATTTIVDANVTTLITAVVLYWIGTDQIKGFAITLILGILMSMYTAIFLARLVFDIAERKRWITSLSMMRMLGATQIDFVAKARGAIALSLVVIVIGIVGVVIRGKTILDIDFTGGSSVTLAFAEKQDISEVRHEVVEATQELRTEVEAAQARVQAATGEVSDRDRALADTNLPIEFTVVGVGDDDRWFKVDTSIRDFGIAQEMLKKQFGERLVTNHMTFSELKTAGLFRAAAPLAAAQGHTLLLSATQPTAFLQDEAAETKPAETPVADQPAAEAPAKAADAPKPEAPQDEAPAADTPAAKATPEAAAEPDLTIEDQPADEQKLLEEQKEAEAKGPKTSTTLTFGEPIKFATLEGLLQENFAANNLIEVPFTLKNVEHEAGSEVPQTTWDLTIDLPADQTQKLLSSLAAQIDAMTVFPSSSNIGGQVAGDTQLQAAYALIASLFFIAGYIWLRFQQFMFGLAAVVALVHDVIITVGCLALSKYLVDYASPAAAAMLVDPFKISLPIVAALLTVIGYSLNDTIVVFDRIREIRGKSPELTPTMINTSINQTLSRTLLTSGTTMLVVVILYIWGGPGIHGFAFSLLVGVGVGTFSSIFIAAPLLLWMSQPAAAPAAKAPEKARA